MNNAEKVMAHLAKSGEATDNKKDAREVMDKKTIHLIKQQDLRITALKEQSTALIQQIAALQTLVRRHEAEIEIRKTAFDKVCDTIDDK